MIKAMLLLGVMGHLLCAVCDCFLIFAEDRKRFDFKLMNDNEKMSAVMKNMPVRKPMLSMLLGVLAIFLMIWGYFGVCIYIHPYSETYAIILFIATLLCMIPITAFHVFCGTAEWYYIRMGRTEEARKTAVDFFKSILPTGIISYLGLFVFCVTLFISVVTGVTDLPKWGCVFNIIFFQIILQTLKVPGAGNISGALMFMGLLFIM